MTQPLYSSAAMRHVHPMTGKVINLRRARKERVRREKRRSGDENAAVHGRLGPEKALTDAQAKQEARRLDGHKREPGANDSPEGEPQE
jgi:hypothetical protein